MRETSLPIKLMGKVKHYKGNGRKLGYPTANMEIATELSDGVYFGYSDLDKYVHCPSLIFIGIPTTIGDTNRRIEAHLLDIPDVDYYENKLTTILVYFHRKNQTFDSINDLQLAMKNDEVIAREWFSRNPESL